MKNKANLRDLIVATSLVILLKLGSMVDFSTRVTLKFAEWPWKIIGRLFYTTLNFVHHFKAISDLKLELQSGNAQFESKVAIFCPLWLWNFKDELEKQQGTFSVLLHYFIAISEFKLKLQSGPLNLGKNRQFLSCVTLKFDGWHWKTIGHLFYATSSSVHHFKAICEYKLELQSRKRLIWVKIGDFFTRMTLKFDNDLEKQ